jgi:hypothetical protein
MFDNFLIYKQILSIVFFEKGGNFDELHKEKAYLGDLKRFYFIV